MKRRKGKMSRGLTLLISIVVFWHSAIALIGLDALDLTLSFA
jgi:hypothetical protein